MNKVLLLLMAMLLIAGLAFAEVLNYSLPVPGVV